MHNFCLIEHIKTSQGGPIHENTSYRTGIFMEDHRQFAALNVQIEVYFKADRLLSGHSKLQISGGPT